MRTNEERVTDFERTLTAKDRRIVARLDSPFKIQTFLDGVPYSAENRYRSPLSVLRDRKAHCYDGGVFAAAMLRRLGHAPLVIDMIPWRDDNHMLALFKNDGQWGAVAKSNFAGLRYREPVYRTVRELVMSYFEGFFNLKRERTLRGYTLPLNLKAFDRLNWLVDDTAMDAIADRLDQVRKVFLLSRRMIRRLTRVDPRSYQSGLVGIDMAGVYRL